MNNYRILVVDDEEDLCEILKFNLENEGYEVDTANSAEEALQMDISRYDLLLLDVMMGEISGFKMARMLKQDKKTAQIPIIFITAKDTENDTVTGFNKWRHASRLSCAGARHPNPSGCPNSWSTSRSCWTSSRRRSASTAKKLR